MGKRTVYGYADYNVSIDEFGDDVIAEEFKRRKLKLETIVTNEDFLNWSIIELKNGRYEEAFIMLERAVPELKSLLPVNKKVMA